jgi:cytochrome c peroxidase
MSVAHPVGATAHVDTARVRWYETCSKLDGLSVGTRRRDERARIVLALGVRHSWPFAPSADGTKAPHGAGDAERKALGAEAAQAGDTVPPDIVPPAAWAALVPEDNQETPERVALGRKLYFDTALSADGTVSCATCHDVSRGFTDQRPVSEGIGGKLGRRNAPTTLNALFFQTQFWDGRAITLEDQAKLPIVNPIEMGMPDGEAAVAKIAGDAQYQKMFQAAYGRAPNYDDIGRAIAAFERTLVFTPRSTICRRR